jgi:predicted small metal-binding protein
MPLRQGWPDGGFGCTMRTGIVGITINQQMEITMPKTYTCRDVGVDCDWKTSAETEDEIMAIVSKHAAEAHPTIELTPELVETVRQAIKQG